MSWRIFYARPSSCLDWLLIWDHPHVLGHFSYGRSPSCFVSYFLWETSIMGDHALSWTAMNFIIIPIFIFWKTPVLSNNILFVGKTLDSQDRFYCTSCFLKKKQYLPWIAIAWILTSSYSDLTFGYFLNLDGYTIGILVISMYPSVMITNIKIH